MALAKGGLLPLSRKRPRRRLGLAPAESVPDGLRRMAVEQTDLALEELTGAEGGEARKAVHETRKAIKRLRTIVRLLRVELGEETCAREQATLRAAAARLAGARDAEVMLGTLDGLVASHPGKLASRAGVARLRRHLESERELAEARMLEPGNRIRVADELRLFRARALAWELGAQPGIAPIEEGLGRIYRQGRRRYRRVAGRRGGRMRTMHQWRKRVKDLRYAAETLRRAARDSSARPKLRGKRRKQANAEARWIARVAGRADDLGELLGEEHDLAVLGAWLSERGRAAGAGRGTRRALHKLIVRRRRTLRRRALREGRRLYRRKPRRFLQRIALAYERSSRVS
jgi:CHAD domain-containing protein